MGKLKIRYTKNGDIESYDAETGQTVGHISTMGNMIKPTQEDKEQREKEIKEIEKLLNI